MIIEAMHTDNLLACIALGLLAHELIAYGAP